MDFTFFAPWHDVLPREPGHVVAFAGGRGKAALQAAAAAVYAAEGIPTAVCGPGAKDPGDGTVVLADADGPADAALRLDPSGIRWPARTSLAVLEAPADAVGGRVDAGCGRGPRPADLADWAVLEWEHLEEAVRQAVAALPPDVPAVLALTGLHAQPDSIGLFAAVGRLMAGPRLAVVLFCSDAEGGPAVRACCRAEPA